MAVENDSANNDTTSISVQLAWSPKGWPSNDALLDVSAAISGRGVTAIYGSSGSGKTTLLRCIAGLERAQEGYVSVKGELWQDSNCFRPVHKRPIGYVFQEASLFSHLTAEQNLNYAIRRSDKPVSDDYFLRVISTLEIESILPQYPHQLSGGERQRIAIARALLIQPSLLLMDEPLASLDESRKDDILPYLEKLSADFELPILYVSHSLKEVSRLADYVLVLEGGRIIDEGTVKDVFSKMGTALVPESEQGVILEGELVERDEKWNLVRFQSSGGSLWIGDQGHRLGAQVRIRILARDVSLSLVDNVDSSILNRLPVTVSAISLPDNASQATIQLKFGEDHLLAQITTRSLEHLALIPVKALWAQIKSVAVVR
ncbi:MAG: molybdenum ABC transporter ATP-binding protein [Cellvibrionaceae bacterium]|nr:molybdenum ABC transporter ATP-binding protein [Cellvibrionaceae bacterium]|tara:strand:+ start:19334 stop:20455 length:1122 start_codon:yes stop_codon:yes gene_type:complete